jgi:hypothetical protein
MLTGDTHQPPAKVARKGNTSPKETTAATAAAAAAIAAPMSQMEAERAARIAANKVGS